MDDTAGSGGSQVLRPRYWVQVEKALVRVQVEKTLVKQVELVLVSVFPVQLAELAPQGLKGRIIES